MSEKEKEEKTNDISDNTGVSQTGDGQFYIDYQGTKVPSNEKIREMLIKQLMAQGKSRQEAEEELKNILDTS
jgi:hypothetical protein